jgi:mannose/cellobiose epimerase-like protein (N-acyl-D-glucosamine 2-epimerase family)
MVKTENTAAAASSDSADIVGVLKTRIIEQSLPLWSGQGWDRATGGFVERLDQDGRADHAAPRRVRVQARQIYCFAKAAQIGWYPQGRDIALKGLEYLLAKAKSPDGRPGFVHSLVPDGSVLNPLRDTYDHAFVLLALASVYALDRNAHVRAEIDSLLSFLFSRCFWQISTTSKNRFLANISRMIGQGSSPSASSPDIRRNGSGC